MQSMEWVSFCLGIPMSEWCHVCVFERVSNSESLEYETFPGRRQDHWAGISEPDSQPIIILVLQTLSKLFLPYLYIGILIAYY